MFKLTKIYPRDIIAIIVIIFGLALISQGVNKIVSGIVIMVVTYYFSKRVYEEKHPNGNLNEKVEKLEEEIKQIPKPPPVPSYPRTPPLQPGQVVIKPPIKQ